MSKYILYNSYFPEKDYFIYQANFGQKLSSKEIENWLNINKSFIQKDYVDDYILSPALGYLFLNKDCKSIIRLNNISNGKSSNYIVADFYKICTLNNSQNIEQSLKDIFNLANSDLKYYLPKITNKLKKALER